MKKDNDIMDPDMKKDDNVKKAKEILRKAEEALKKEQEVAEENKNSGKKTASVDQSDTPKEMTGSKEKEVPKTTPKTAPAEDPDDVGDDTPEVNDTGSGTGKSRKTKKGIPKWGRVLIIIGAVLLLVALVVWIGIKMYLGRINRIEERSRTPREQETFEASSDEGVDTISADQVKWDELYEQVKQDKEIKNIILIGQDRRPTDTVPARSDSMILCSINKKTNKITLISFMRDMYVPIEGYSDNRINAAYNYGGAVLLKETIEKDFGIGIDNAIEVDFEGFIKAMTSIGDLEIELTQDEADYLNGIGSVMNAEAGLTGGDNWNLKAGKNMLKADQALAYSRTRHVGRSDWERTDRQRRVLMAAFNKVSEMGISEQLDLVNAVIPYFATDMTDSEILGYVYYIAKEGIHVGDTFRVPADGAYTNERINNMAVLVPNLQKNSDLIKEALYPQ